jgi:glycosyltransferase involved in cell wall biosynthesis
MAKEAKSSYVFKLQDVVFAPNVNQLLNLTDAPTPRARTNRNQLRVGVASMDPNAYLKFGEVISELMTSEEILTAGIEIVTRTSFPQNDLGHLDFWGSIDCLLAISRADNSPNVIHEAKIAGIPVIATNVGGIPELLTDNFDICFEPSLVSTKEIIACLIYFRKSLPVIASLQSHSTRNYEN